MMKALKQRQQRTQDLIEGFRGLPGEFSMLKGILCASHTVANQEAKRNGYESGAKIRRTIESMFDGHMIAVRMDEINRVGIQGMETALGMRGYAGSPADKEDRANGQPRVD